MEKVSLSELGGKTVREVIEFFKVFEETALVTVELDVSFDRNGEPDGEMVLVINE